MIYYTYVCVYCIIYIGLCVLKWAIPQIVKSNQVNRESDDYITRSTLFLDKDISLTYIHFVVCVYNCIYLLLYYICVYMYIYTYTYMEQHKSVVGLKPTVL